jgi:DNA-binding MarR family transcriptional regulator
VPTVKDAIKQTRPFASNQDEAFVTLVRTADELSYEVAQLLRSHDLTPTQYNALRILRGAGPEGLSCNEVGQRMITKVPDITRLLDRLEAAGLVGRVRTPSDRRVVQVHITRRGLDRLQAIDEPTADLHRRQFANLSKADLRELIRLLEEARQR